MTNQSKSYQNLVTMMEGDILIYQRKGSKTGKWNCTIKVPNRGRERFSLGTKDLDIAKQNALNKYQFMRTRYDQNLPTKSMKWKDVFDAYQKIHNRVTYNQRGAYWHEFFGKFKDLSVVTSDVMVDYWEWRIHYWLDEKNLARKAKESKNAMYHIARKPNLRTLKMEANALRNIFQFARNEGLLNKIPVIRCPENHPNVEVENKRGWFSTEDLGKLQKELQIRCDPTGALKINRLKKDRRKGHQHPQQDLCWLRLRLAVWMIANSGIRPAELLQLRFCDIKREFMPYSKGNRVLIPFVYADILRSVSKVRKPREAFFRDMEKAWEMVQNFRGYRSKLEPREIEDNDLIFSSYRDHKRAANLSVMFRKILEDLDIRENIETGHIRTLYSLRAYYITYQLTHNLALPIHILALNCGTSTKMIEKHYSKIITRSFRDHFIATLSDRQKEKYGIGVNPIAGLVDPDIRET